MAMAMPIPSPIDGYVKDGLVLAYDGYQEPSGGVWKDLSGSGNDMIVGAGASFDSDYHCFSFTVGGQYALGDCKTSKEVSLSSAVTIEFICAAETSSNAIIFKCNTTWPYHPSINFGSFLNIYLPESCKTPWLVSEAISTDHSVCSMHYYAVDGTAVRYKQYGNNQASEGTATNSSAITGGSQVLYIGGKETRIYALRIYNRALTDAEMVQNRTLDITRFSL